MIMSVCGHIMEKRFLTTKEVAQILRLSDRHIRRLINQNLIPAKKVGRSFIIDASQLNPIFQKATETEKQFIHKTIKKIIKEYGETLRLLGSE